jgi:hypothetical protein
VKLLDRVRYRLSRRAKRHEQAPAQSRQPEVPDETPWVPRNREERRSIHKMVRHEGRRRMRLAGKRRHNFRVSKRVRDQQRHIKAMIRDL